MNTRPMVYMDEVPSVESERPALWLLYAFVIVATIGLSALLS